MAQDNLRDHGDNCFLHDEGEYSRCFCGKDSLSDHLQSVVEKLDEALAQPEQKPVKHELLCVCGCTWEIDSEGNEELIATPPQRKPLTDEEIDKLPWEPHEGNPMTFAEGLRYFARAIEAAHGIKEAK